MSVHSEGCVNPTYVDTDVRQRDLKGDKPTYAQFIHVLYHITEFNTI